MILLPGGLSLMLYKNGFFDPEDEFKGFLQGEIPMKVSLKMYTAVSI